MVVFVFYVLFEFLALSAASAIPGHLQYLGSHRPSEGVVEVTDTWLEPEVFYNDYIKPGKPILFKGKAKDIPAFTLWTDDHLRKKYGGLKIDLEVGKKETRKGDNINVNMSSFLDLYKKSDIYMVYSLAHELMDEFHIPKPLLCGGYTKMLQDSVMWFSSGGTKSVLHSDDIDNINCLMDGTKRLVFIDKQYKDLVEKDGFQQNGGYSSLDVEKVDLEMFPGIRSVPWWEADMEKGDCLFIPTGWYHHVSSTGPRNLAVNIWFSHLMQFNHTDCQRQGALPETLPLSQFKVASINKNEVVRQTIIEMLGEFYDQNEINMEEFLEASKVIESIVQRDVLREMFDFIDDNHDALLDWLELNGFDIDEFVAKFPVILRNEVQDAIGADTEENEQKHEEL